MITRTPTHDPTSRPAARGRSGRALLLIALGLATAVGSNQAAPLLLPYTLSGSPDGTGIFLVDDNLDVFLNDAVIYTENLPIGASQEHDPIVFNAEIGDRIRIRVRDTHGDCARLTRVFLTDSAGRSVLADMGFDAGCGRPPGDNGVAHERLFVIPDLAVLPVGDMLPEIRPGSAGSNPDEMRVFQGALYFSADDGVTGRELWRLDASGLATRVADISPGPGSSSPQRLTVVGDVLYFRAFTPATGVELWKYDGVTEPTLAADINPGAGSSLPQFLTAFANKVVFRANDGTTGEELYSYGAAGLTRFNIYEDDDSCAPDCGSSPYGLTPYGFFLYFGAASSNRGTELYRYNGVSVQRLTDIAPGRPSSSPSGMIGLGERLVFGAYNAFGQNQLFSYHIHDGTVTQIDIGSNFFGSFPTDFVRAMVGGPYVFAGTPAAYFVADNGVHGRELWLTDGTQAGTLLIADIFPGPTGSSPSGFIRMPSGELYFTATSDTVGREPRAFNGSTVRLIADLNPGPAGSDVAGQVVLGHYLYFVSAGAGPGLHPWYTNGTSAMTERVTRPNGALINPTGSAIDDTDLTVFNGAVYFSATDGVNGFELWRAMLPGTSPTTTELTSSPNPSVLGDEVTFVATVSGLSPTGTVTLFVDGTPVATELLAGSTASFTTSALELGSHTITATYNSDTDDAPSTSDGLVQIVNGVATTVDLESSLNPSVLGDEVTFTATVSGQAPAGTVTFFADGAPLDSPIALVGGAASLTTSGLGLGSHQIVAEYSGDATNAPGTSSPLRQDVTAGPASTVVTSSLNPSSFGDPVTFTASVSGLNPTGTVVFAAGATPLGPPVSLSLGTASLTTSGLPAGSHEITAAYSGDPLNGGSTSPPVTQVVNRALPVIGLFSSNNPSLLGEEVTLTATLDSAATGTVEFLDGTTSIGVATVGGGEASLTLSTLGAGEHSLVARYSGDVNYLPADSSPLVQTVTLEATVTVIKHVINDNGGTLQAGDFSITVYQGGEPVATFPGSETGTPVAVTPGPYAIAEADSPGYAGQLSTDCAGTIAAGETRTCTITNDDIPPSSPPVADSQAVTTLEDTPAPITLTGSDADNAPLAFVVQTQPSHGTLSGTAPNLTYLPDADYNGPDGFTFKVNNGARDSSVATVTIDVTPVNDAPTAIPQSVTTAEDVSQLILLAGSDVDGDALTYRIVTGPSHGTLSGALPAVTYVPHADYFGTDGFSFVANDGSVDSAAAAVAITITPVNDAPVAMPDSLGAAVKTAVIIDVLANDDDVDGDVLTIVATTKPANGRIRVNADNTITYTGNAKFQGTDSFTYTVGDGNGGFATATVTMFVGTNRPPKAVADRAETVAGTPVAIAVLANDSDPDGDPLTIVGVTQGTNGTVAIDPGGTVTYVPGPGFTGGDRFFYTISDGQGATATASVRVRVKP